MNNAIGYLQANPALVLATLSLLFAVYAFFRKDAKDVKVDVRSFVDLFASRNEESKRFTILYDKVAVGAVSIVMVRIKNHGRVAVPPVDFHNPLQLNFGENSIVLSAEHVISIPGNVRPKLSYHANSADITAKTFVRVEPLLLNQGASILLKFLVSNSDSCIPSGDIVGVKNIYTASYISGMRDLLQNRKFHWRK
jgi:hypothetical protein